MQQLAVAVPGPFRSVAVCLLCLQQDAEESPVAGIDEIPLHVGTSHRLIRKFHDHPAGPGSNETPHHQICNGLFAEAAPQRAAPFKEVLHERRKLVSEIAEHQEAYPHLSGNCPVT